LSILEEFFQLPAGYIFLTPEEQTLVSTRAGRALEPSTVIGMGLEPAAGRCRAADPAASRAPYLLYLGASIATRGATRCSSISSSTPPRATGFRWCSRARRR
jgi:hypothetical protein